MFVYAPGLLRHPSRLYLLRHWICLSGQLAPGFIAIIVGYAANSHDCLSTWEMNSPLLTSFVALTFWYATSAYE